MDSRKPGQGDASEALVWEWRETGGPAPSNTGRRGFGSFLIERVLGAEFEGKVKLELRPDGLVLHPQSTCAGREPAQ